MALQTILKRLLAPLVVLMLCLVLLEWAFPSVQKSDAVSRGRDVYIQEGCINCHSQYIRPQGEDEKIFGPSNHNTLNESPPLIGNRRNGPDLSNAGLLKSSLWHKLHLINPRVFQAHSSMPSYEVLFKSDRGDDLVMYLSSLGKEHWNLYWEERLMTPFNLPKDQSPSPETVQHGALIYKENCFVCHGEVDRSFNSIAPLAHLGLNAPALGIVLKGYCDSDGHFSAAAKDLIAKWIRYGIPNGNMPSHHHLSSLDIENILQYFEISSLKLLSSPSESKLKDATP
jgi:cbb3-type cytochrome oxidase cytochrome c subunit